MVNTTKARRPAAPRTRRPAGRRTATRLTDLNGPKLYAMIIYRLSMTALIVFALIEIGSQGS